MNTNGSVKSMGFRLDAYRYLEKNPKGLRDELIGKITRSVFNEFCNVGILSQGLDGNWIARYKVTDFGKEQINSVLEIESLTKELSDIVQRYS